MREKKTPVQGFCLGLQNVTQQDNSPSQKLQEKPVVPKRSQVKRQCSSKCFTRSIESFVFE